MKVVEVGFENATIEATLPASATGAWVEYTVGKFPSTQDFVSAETGAAITSTVITEDSHAIGRGVELLTNGGTPNGGTITHQLAHLTPGETYKVAVRPTCESTVGGDNTSMAAMPCEGFAHAKCSLTVKTPASTGHVCKYFNATQLEGHDQPALVSENPPADGNPSMEGGEPPVVEGAEECCDMCAKVVPLRPYSPPCRFFAFENTTKKCYLKDAKAMDGKVEKEGWTSGQVVLV
mmetsp:Transcript_12141/g.25485  ORF Transcript_12141/g.25485 Transcript_12141/m.25485 type:complete len:235 (-) Transcript_12141:270-974(-)